MSTACEICGIELEAPAASGIELESPAKSICDGCSESRKPKAAEPQVDIQQISLDEEYIEITLGYTVATAKLLDDAIGHLYDECPDQLPSKHAVALNHLWNAITSGIPPSELQEAEGIAETEAVALAEVERETEKADEQPEYIDLTPTWAGLMPGLFAVLESGKPEGKATAREEIMRLAEHVDAMNRREGDGA